MRPWLAVLVMVVSGAFMAFQAPINARLRSRVGAVESSLVSFGVGALLLSVAVALAGKGSLPGVRQAQPWELLGGAIGAVFVTTTLLSAPVIGVTGMIVAALAGQLCLALLIDTFGWVGVARKPLDLPRVAGLALLVVALVLINWNSWRKPV
jgi:bacterial/archaeal transporter family-2 protein